MVKRSPTCSASIVWHHATYRQSVSVFLSDISGEDRLLSLCFSPNSQQNVARPGALDREVRRLGRSLVLSEDDYEDDDYDDDLMDLEASNVIFTPLLRSAYLGLCLPQITSLCVLKFWHDMLRVLVSVCAVA